MSSNATNHHAEGLRDGSPKKQKPVSNVSPVHSSLTAEEEARVQATFTSFAPRGEMVGAKWAKFCKDNKLQRSKLSSTDVDLIFAKSVAKGTRKLSYAQFRHIALPLVSEKRGSNLDKILRHICKNGGGPVFKGTKAEKVRHHDDKSTYTGVYGRGGPTTVDIGETYISLGGEGQGFKSLADRSEYDVRGVKVQASRGDKIAAANAKSAGALAGATFVDTDGETGTSINDDGNDSKTAGCEMQSFLLSLNIPTQDAVSYTAKLKDDGFDVVEDLKRMSEGDFLDIGMRKGHMRKVMNGLP